MKTIRIERGWIGHFICGNECRFRRNTLLENGDIRVVISTVGNYYPEPEEKINTIGCNRYYETMAFIAKKEGEYWEADVSRQIYFKSNWALDYWDSPTIDIDADKMHEAVIAEIMRKINRGLNLDENNV